MSGSQGSSASEDTRLPGGQELASVSRHNGRDPRQQLKQLVPVKKGIYHYQQSGEKNHQIKLNSKSGEA